jgi:hypothetical protein
LLSVYGNPSVDLESLAQSGESISSAEVIGWFRTAGSAARLPEPAESTPGMERLVRELNLIRVTEDAETVMTTPGEPFALAEERLWRDKQAILTLRDDLPRRIEALESIKGVRGTEAMSDREIGPLIRLYEAVTADLPFVMSHRLRDLAGHTGKSRAPWHDVAGLIAERATFIWRRVSKRQLGVGKATSPLVNFVALALPRVGQGNPSNEAIFKALTRRRADN